MEPSRNISRLLEIMRSLRDPETGCPWDIQQNFSTIAPYTVEEAYEVADAIERGEREELKSELGDLLLQVVYHARMAEEEGSFDFGDVVHSITDKMIRRHPHVFGNDPKPRSELPADFWEKIKESEHAARGADSKAAAAYLDSVSVALPALTRAQKLQAKAARVGFDWNNAAKVIDKIKEEIDELENAADSQSLEEEFGDLMFALVNYARHKGIDSETALRNANRKFFVRFSHVEKSLAAKGRSLEHSTLDEMESLWNEAKHLAAAQTIQDPE